ncbi:MAG: PA0069 family radical SAM protein [Proteobacteria bacterium]|nr:PA0069 family radical SAM protein [Pseudomonadota bacterium]
MLEVLPDLAVKGRGAISNRAGRFEALTTERIADGWDFLGAELDQPKLATVVIDERSKSIISTNTSPDLPFNRSINPYRGCEHGCVYCFARPTHTYLGLSAGLDFETRLFAKPDAAELLRRAFRDRRYRPEKIQLGANTDPYQPIERARRITRGILEVMHEFRHPVGITTKGHLVTRDLDLLAPMAADRLAAVAISITTLDGGLARRLEPRAPTPKRRLDAVRALSRAGVPVAVMVAPVIPGLNDHEIEDILAAARATGAASAEYILLRLPLELEALVSEWLATHAPNKAKKVMNLIRETRGGRAYESTFGVRMRGRGTYADLIEIRFKAALRRERFRRNAAAGFDLRTDLFERPSVAGDQLTLF